MLKARLLVGPMLIGFVVLLAGPAAAQVFPYGTNPTTSTTSLTTSTTSAGGTTTTTPGGVTTTTPAGVTTTIGGGGGGGGGTTTTPASVPPTTAGPGTTTGGGGGGGTQNGGTHVLGETFVNEVCGFQPGAPVSLVTNGQPTGSAIADPNGCVAVTVRVISTSQVQVNGITVGSVCGANHVIAAGPSNAAGPFVQTDTFTVNCGVAPASAISPTSPTSATRASTGGLAFTGANVLRLGGAAVLLLLFGGLLVVADRRRGRVQG